MYPTIRQHYRRRMFIAMPLYLGGLVLLVLAIGWADSVSAGARSLLPVLGGAAAFCAGLYLSVTARCPKCDATMSPWVSMYPAWNFWRRPERCPHCAVSLDEHCA